MNAFARASAAVFQDRNMAADAVFIARGVAPGRAVRIIRRMPDRLSNFGDGRFVTDSVLIDVQVADVPELAVGDRFQVGTVLYEVRSEPVRDAERLVWAAEAREL